MNQDTIFEKILRHEIPYSKVYEDEWTFAFDDIHPVAPVHVLVIPKIKKVNMNDVTQDDALLLGRLMIATQKVAELKQISHSGYRLVFNNGSEAGQTVFYMHCHVIGGKTLSWPP